MPASPSQFVVIGLVIVIAVVGHSSGTATVELAADGVGHLRQLLVLLIKVILVGGVCVLVEPVLSLFDGFQQRLLLLLIDLASETLVVVGLVLQRHGVILKLVAGLDLLSDHLVLFGELLRFLDHA